MKRLFTILLLLSVSLFSQATNYYVATNGDNDNPGTFAAPFLNITKGLSIAGAGDTVFIKAGIYTGEYDFPSSGTIGNPIVLKNYNNEVVTVDGQSASAECFYAYNKHDITIDGINVKNAMAHNIMFNACQNITIKNLSSTLPVDFVSSTINNITLQGDVIGTMTGITIQNITTYGGFMGIYIGWKVNGVNITGGEYSYARVDGISIGGSTGDDRAKNIVIDRAYSHHNGMQGIDAMHCEYVIIRNSHCSYNCATGIQIEADSDNALVEDNLCEYNSRGGGYVNSTLEGGIWIYNSINSIVRRNIMRGNLIGFIVFGTSNFQAYDNLIINNNFNQIIGDLDSENTAGVSFGECDGTFYNNTLYGNCASNSKLGSIYTRPTSETEPIPVNIILKNNIVMNDGSSGSYTGSDMHFNHLADATVVSDNNLVYNANRTVKINVKGTDYTWFEYVALEGNDQNSLNVNPLFVDPSNGNFNLKFNSPAINAGADVGLTADYYNRLIRGLPDAGAIEWAGYLLRYGTALVRNEGKLLRNPE
jgi:parallel beta-helix repeat protein